MATGSTTDLLVLLLIISLVLTVATCAFWPPHRHAYIKIIAEQWDYHDSHYVCRQCVCGKTKEYFYPLEDSNS